MKKLILCMFLVVATSPSISYSDDIAGSESLFNEDLNNDGAIGIDTGR